MRNQLLKTLAILLVILGLSSRVHDQFSFGIRIGEPPAPRVYRVPPCPGPDYVWVEGYYFPEDHYGCSMATSIPSKATKAGTTGIATWPPIKARIGLSRTTSANSTTTVIGPGARAE